MLKRLLIGAVQFCSLYMYILYKLGRNGVVVRASASKSVDQMFIPLVESCHKTLKNGIRSFPAWRSAFREVVENKPASSLVVSLGKALNGTSQFYVEDRWPINLEKGNSQASAEFPSKV